MPESPDLTLKLDAWESLLQGEARRNLETVFLPVFLEKQRWFGGKGRLMRRLGILHATPLAGSLWLVLQVEYAEGPGESYQAPLAFVPGMDGLPAAALVAEAEMKGRPGYLIDAMVTPEFTRGWVDFFCALAEGGAPQAEASPAFLEACREEPPVVTPLRADQSNSAALLGRRFFFKLYRRLEAGFSPEAEMVRYLGDTAGFAGTPAWRGDWRIMDSRGEATALALITDQVASPVNGWDFLQGALRPLPEKDGGESTLDFVTTLGRRTAEMHGALGLGKTPAFAPEPFAAGEAGLLASGISREMAHTLDELAGTMDRLPPEARRLAATVLERKAALERPLRRLASAPVNTLGLKTRTHGDYHLGQVLVHAEGVALLDFEGEPARTLAERRAKQSPLRDVSGMLRSLHYAAMAARLLPGQGPAPDALALQAWHAVAQAAYLAAYWATARGTWLAQDEGRRDLLAAFLVEKAVYELRYELRNRPDWVAIPLGGLAMLAEG